jgi:8-oxo-dGTP pyrophosphatase MutT (NUDIX family)
MGKLLDKYLEELTTRDDEKEIKVRTNVAGAIIVKEGENGEKLVLLIQRSADDHWPLYYEIPRGGCDFGNRNSGKDEPIIKCLRRETKEECGLDVKPIKFIDKFSYIADQGTRESTQYNYLCEMTKPNQEVKLSKEHQDFKWVQSIGIVELMVLPEIKKSIIKVFNLDKQIVTYPESELSDEKIEEIINKRTRYQGRNSY